jgi:hypothetical protein
LELDLGNNCSSPPALLGGCGLNPGHVPTKTDTPDYIGHFHAQYHGDACDMNATTAAVPARVRDPLGRTAPCIRCTIIGSGGSCGTTSQVCPAFLTSGISFNSYIGNSLGNAQATPGTSAPSFCQCPGADTDPNWHVDCQTQKSAPQCTIASDILFPSGQLNQSGSGWFPISEAGTVSRADQLPFPALATTHQEFSDDTSGANGPYNPNLGALATWDFPANLGEFSQLASAKSLTGVLWGHVVSFTPQPQTNPQPLVNTPNSYVPSTVSLEGETLFTVFNVRYAPVSGIWEEGGSAVNLGDPPWETIVAGVSTPIEQTIAGEARLAGERFDSAGLSLLTGVGAGTSDLLVGDDVITGVPFRSNLVAAVVVDHGTTNVHGAFTVSPIGQVTTVTGGRTTFAADPPDLRSYDANDALLRSLHVDTSGASVTVLDVQAALAGVTSTATMSVTGAAPRTPLALAWNGAEASLYVVDAMPSGAKDMALRLLRIDRKYGSRELWRLEGVRKLPDAVLLSMSPQNERVLGIVSEGHSEVAAFDSVGSPQWSLSVAGDFAAAPISTESGASLALRRHKDTSRGLLKLRFVSRGKAANHLCGTHWLRQHVITSPRSVLGDPSVECGEEHQDEDDGDD